MKYNVTLNGKSLMVTQNDGLIEIKLKATKSPSRLVIEK